MHIRFGKVLMGAALVACAVATSSASTPRFWQVATQADFLRGEVENLSIDGDGRLLLGPGSEQVSETSAPFLWSLIAAPDGGLWAGSGNEGKVFRIDRTGKATTFFDSTELEAHALAPAPNGGLYVATSPDGKIYKVAADGTSSVFFDTEDKYIWALAVDRTGVLYAGTGERGTVYRISPDGKGAPFYHTKATHVTALAIDGSGNVLAGTESPGRVFKIDPAGKAFVLLDSSFREIHALRIGPQGVVYAAAVSGKPAVDDRPIDRPLETTRSAPVPSVSTEITAIALGDVQVGPSASMISPRPDRDLKGAVYRIRPDGLWDVVWDSVEDLPYDLIVEPDGALLIGTGGKGKIFRVTGDPSTTTLLTRAGAQQITMFFRDQAGVVHYATANPGKIFKLGSSRAEKGSYLSDVRDASTVATWGSIRWRATTPSGTQVQLLTRSGNTATPDDTWSDWSTAYANANGEQISSPKARYLQWRAVLTGRTASPVLTSVTAAYLERNLRPLVSGITVHPPGAVFQKPFSTGELEIAGYDDTPSDSRASQNTQGAAGATPAPQLGRRAYQKGLQTFVWKADDQNDDRLQFDVLYRSEGETSWRTLKRALSDPILVWDTSSVPDGTYMIKVIASDSPSNSPGDALSGEYESTTFDIDNTPPRIQIDSVQRDGARTSATFSVEDAHSPVQRVEYSLDANRWRVVYPKDGIPDSRREEFDIQLEAEPPARNIIIRATDAMSNVATAVGEPTTATTIKK